MFASILLFCVCWGRLFCRQCPCPRVGMLVVVDMCFGLLLLPCRVSIPRGERCYCWELRGSRSFIVRRLKLMSEPRELAVVDSLAELLWIKQSIIWVRAEICGCRGSRLAFILSSTNSGEDLMLFSSLPSVIPLSASPVFSSPCADTLGCNLKSYEFRLLNVLHL